MFSKSFPTLSCSCQFVFCLFYAASSSLLLLLLFLQVGWFIMVCFVVVVVFFLTQWLHVHHIVRYRVWQLEQTIQGVTRVPQRLNAAREGYQKDVKPGQTWPAPSPLPWPAPCPQPSPDPLPPGPDPVPVPFPMASFLGHLPTLASCRALHPTSCYIAELRLLLQHKIQVPMVTSCVQKMPNTKFGQDPCSSSMAANCKHIQYI
jgi:hypothetical protein